MFTPQSQLSSHTLNEIIHTQSLSLFLFLSLSLSLSLCVCVREGCLDTSLIMKDTEGPGLGPGGRGPVERRGDLIKKYYNDFDSFPRKTTQYMEVHGQRRGVTQGERDNRKRKNERKGKYKQRGGGNGDRKRPQSVTVHCDPE